MSVAWGSTGDIFAASAFLLCCLTGQGFLTATQHVVSVASSPLLTHSILT